ncbi:MAG: sugar ABC transporter permease [Candidatus Eremiobacterota bacterium]
MKNRTAYLFMAPAMILLAVFTLYPMLVGTALAFFDFNLLRHTPEGSLRPPRFIGLENLVRLASDPYFAVALKNSLLYLLVVPAIQLASILLAVLVNQPLRGRTFFRAALYVPVITSIVIVGIAWKWLLRSDGLVNAVLGDFGVAPVGWLTQRDLALFSVMFVTMWQGLGYYMMLYLAGLQSIPPEFEEAARIDGAGPWQVLTRITIPLLKPTVALCSIISCISALKVFGEIYVMTEGGPENGTLTMVYYIYDRAFEHYQMGYSSAVSLVLAVVVGIISYLNVSAFREGGLQSYHG